MDKQLPGQWLVPDDNPCSMELSSSGSSVSSTRHVALGPSAGQWVTPCHAGMNLYNDSFTEAYPHRVTMPFETAGLDTVDAETMVQFCLVMPMGTDPLPWQSQELAALSAYIEKIQPEYAAAVP